MTLLYFNVLDIYTCKSFQDWSSDWSWLKMTGLQQLQCNPLGQLWLLMLASEKMVSYCYSDTYVLKQSTFNSSRCKFLDTFYLQFYQILFPQLLLIHLHSKNPLNILMWIHLTETYAVSLYTKYFPQTVQTVTVGHLSKK